MLTPVPTRRPRRIAADGPHIQPQSIRPTFVDAPTEEFEPVASPSAGDIADSLRRSTLRAHHVLKHAGTAPETLRSLRAEVADLENEIDRLGLRKLRPFVGALRRRIEASL
ncbi:hypothetical protein [Paludisphaera soli]|uniref:hypothetical protein n=1 Tax=Paludisphaera soli TaxID=2712865 RepID=UPI0013ED0C31|nr:hypothetical protein [Paludisphaera soli]